MANTTDIREGMQVYGANDQVIGTVEKLHGDGFHVKGEHYSRDMVARVAQNRVYLRGTGMAGSGARGTGTTEGEIRVPMAEERLSVGKREAELGEVEIRKTVTEEQVSVPVTLRRDEVHVEEVNVADRPLRAGEDAFDEGTIRVQLRGEEAVVSKEAVVTGEVVVNKETVSQEQQVSGTVRKQHVEVDKAYQQARTGLEQAHTTRAGGTGRAFEQAEPNYRAGFTAAHDERYAGRDFEDAESDLRTQHTSSGSAGDSWEQLREEVREGWNKARGR